jgi:hypothetical protein
MTTCRVLRVRIDTTVLALPAALVRRIGRLDRPAWAGLDGRGAPLFLAATEQGPLVAVAASSVWDVAALSPRPAWAVVIAGPGEPLLAVAVCDVLGLAEGEPSPGLLNRAAPAAPEDKP